MKDDVTTSDLIYAAATIDCEGSIGIGMRKGRRKSPYFHVRVQVGNTDSILTNWLCETFGGSTYVREFSNQRWKTNYNWYIDANQACDFLGWILPYMKLKWQQAELALKLEDAVKSYVGLTLSESEIEKRLALKEAVGILNKKGR